MTKRGGKVSVFDLRASLRNAVRGNVGGRVLLIGDRGTMMVDKGRTQKSGVPKTKYGSYHGWSPKQMSKRVGGFSLK